MLLNGTSQKIKRLVLTFQVAPTVRSKEREVRFLASSMFTVDLLTPLKTRDWLRL